MAQISSIGLIELTSVAAGYLVQDTMLRAFRFFDRFEPGTNAKAWLFKILHNAFVNRYRRRLREQRVLDEIERGDHYEGFVAAEGTGPEIVAGVFGVLRQTISSPPAKPITTSPNFAPS